MSIVIRHIIAWGLSALLLFSTVSFTVELHYCGKRLVEIALNEHVNGCGMEAAANEAPDSCVKSAMHCCQDVQLSFSGQRDLQTLQYSNDLERPVLAIETLTEQLQLPGIRKSAPAGYQCYFPPPLIKDIPVLHQSFLI